MLQIVLVNGMTELYIGACLVKVVDCFTVLAMELLGFAFEFVRRFLPAIEAGKMSSSCCE